MKNITDIRTPELNAYQYILKFIAQATLMTPREQQVWAFIERKFCKQIKKQKDKKMNTTRKKYLESFTAVEQRIIELLLSDKTYTDISDAVGISMNNLYNRISVILKKSKSFIDFDEEKPKKDQFIAFFKDSDSYSEDVLKRDVTIKPKEETDLTATESNIFDLLIEGLTYQQVAEQLVISITTVKSHVVNIFSKKCVNSLPQLIVQEYKRRLNDICTPAGNNELQPSDVYKLRRDNCQSAFEKYYKRQKEALDDIAKELGFLYMDSKNIPLDVIENAEKTKMTCIICEEIKKEIFNAD